MQNEAKNSTKRAKQKNRRNKNQKQTKQQPKRQTKNLHSDIGPHTVPKDNDLLIFRIGMAIFFFFFEWRPVSFGGSRCIDTARLPRQDRGPVSGGNRSAASCICTVLRRALCHYSKRSPLGLVWRENKTQAGTKHHKQNRHTRDERKQHSTAREPGWCAHDDVKVHPAMASLRQLLTMPYHSVYRCLPTCRKLRSLPPPHGCIHPAYVSSLHGGTEHLNPLSYWQRPAAHFGMSQEVLPQQITDLETATRQLSWLILRSAQQRATRSAKHKRHSWCCHAQRKALVLLSWSSWLGGGLVSAQGCVACMAMLLFCSLFFFVVCLVVCLFCFCLVL